MVNVTIIDTMKTKELDNGKFMTTHKAQDLEAKQYTFNFFGQPLKKGTEVELIKQGLYWNFVKIIEDEETKENIPTADNYMLSQDDKILFGQCINIVWERYKQQAINNKKQIGEDIKEVFEINKKVRKECLGY